MAAPPPSPGPSPDLSQAAPQQLVPDKGDFTNWYKTVLEYTRFLDDRYPLKGCYVWRPFGYRSLKLFLGIVDEVLQSSGCEEVCFPLLSPASQFGRESDFLKGMQTESLRVTKYGDDPLGEDLVVRPTSETIMYPMFALWIRSQADLPLRVYQTVPVYRWETKMTVPMLRLREITKFNEAHTVHATREDMVAQIDNALESYRQIFSRLLIPSWTFLTPSWDTFPGAEYNFDVITVLPHGKAVELGSVIALGKRFSGVYDIGYADEAGNRQPVWQTCYGLSERSVGTAIALHGDSRGLRLPSEIAPVQIVIVPIHRKEEPPGLSDYARELQAELSRSFRVELDDRELMPGRKYYHWEAHGVPVRLEVGAREMKGRNVTVVGRHRGERSLVGRDVLPAALRRLFDEHDDTLRTEAGRSVEGVLHRCGTAAEARQVLETSGGIVEVPWDGSVEQGKALGEEVGGSALGVRVEGTPAHFSPEEVLARRPLLLAFAKTV